MYVTNCYSERNEVCLEVLRGSEIAVQRLCHQRADIVKPNHNMAPRECMASSSIRLLISQRRPDQSVATVCDEFHIKQ